MRIQGSRKLFPYLFMLGIFFGIFYVNFLAKDHVFGSGIFSDFFLEHDNGPESIGVDYFFYLIYIRFLPLAVILLLSGTKARRVSVLLVVLWTGFITGFTFTAAILKLGLKGLVLCLICLMPHMPCYMAAYVLVLRQIYYGAGRIWNGARVGFFLTVSAIGLFTEYYLNPVLVSVFIKTLS